MKSLLHAAGLLAAISILSPLAWGQQREIPDTISLDRIPRIYGIGMVQDSGKEPGALWLATPLGVYRATPWGEAVRVRGVDGVVMGFATTPGKKGMLYAGGHPGRTGSIGLLRSTDGGRTWRQLSRNAAGEVGFHVLEVSKADPDTLYGIADGLRVSGDGGRTWRKSGGLPNRPIHFAASAKSVHTVYAGTQGGLYISEDQGKRWREASLPKGVTSMVHVTRAGKVYAFVVRQGLFVADEGALRFRKLAGDFSGRVILRMIADPARPERLYAATYLGAVVTSADGGKSWQAYEGSHNARPAVISKGEKLFNTYCVACHGPKGRGQEHAPGFNPQTPPPIMAPALDDTAHGWHHSDESLIHTIMEGSPREGSPMVAWKKTLSRGDAESLVAYIKSLWSFQSIACQGARHMACMRHR